MKEEEPVRGGRETETWTERTRKKGLREGQGHGIGSGSDQLGIRSVSLSILRRIVVNDCGAAPNLRPQWTLPGLGRWSKAVGVLWSLAIGPADPSEQLSHVYDGIFLLLHQSASSTA